MSSTTLLALGFAVLRDGEIVLPASAQERAQAQRALQDHLTGSVRDRLCSYWHPYQGRVDVREVTLTAEEESVIRAAADEIFALTA